LVHDQKMDVVLTENPVYLRGNKVGFGKVQPVESK
jgi:hypothetical protein